MEINVTYGDEVIYDVGSNLAYPGPRGAQRHREIRGPARNRPRSGSISFLKNWIPDLLGGFAAACPGNASADVIYAETSSMVPRAPDRVARSAIARSEVQRKDSRTAAQCCLS